MVILRMVILRMVILRKDESEEDEPAHGYLAHGNHGDSPWQAASDALASGSSSRTVQRKPPSSLPNLRKARMLILMPFQFRVNVQKIEEKTEAYYVPFLPPSTNLHSYSYTFACGV